MRDDIRAASTDEIRAACQGNREARERVARSGWDRVRRRAHLRFTRWKIPAWLGPPTACVGAAFMRVFGRSRAQWRDREQFARCVDRILEHVIIEQRRLGGAAKRGAARTRDDLSAALASDDVVRDLAARESVERLAALDAESFRMVEMSLVERRTHDEIGALLGRSSRSVEHRIAAFLAQARRRLAAVR